MPHVNAIPPTPIQLSAHFQRRGNDVDGPKKKADGLVHELEGRQDSLRSKILLRMTRLSEVFLFWSCEMKKRGEGEG